MQTGGTFLEETKCNFRGHSLGAKGVSLKQRTQSCNIHEPQRLADVVQLEQQLIRNQSVGGLTSLVGSDRIKGLQSKKSKIPTDYQPLKCKMNETQSIAMN